MVRALVVLILVAGIGAGAAYAVAGRGEPPRITITKPDRALGQAGTLEVSAEAPNAELTLLNITLEQSGRSVPLFSLDKQDATVARPDPGRLQISRPLGKQSVPELQSGTARIVVTAARPSFWKLRQLTRSETKDIQVRLEPPRVAVLSTHHYVNHGGSEMVLYRTTPADVASGVRVGSIEYPGFPASGAGMTGATPETKVAFFALLHDQALNTPIAAFARDEAGNETKSSFIDNVFPKRFKKSRIELDDKFIDRVVPDIIEHSPELRMTPPASGSPEMAAAFVRINSELRKANAEQIAALSTKTSPTRLWTQPFVQLGGSQVEAGFADHRTYVYKGKEIDQQTHLGFDLAVTARVPVAAANDGVVMNANWLGIYGNCVVVDHGMGLQTLYGHLSSFDVGVGDKVTRGQTIGRSGMTGMAGGDHLHFTMLVGGQMVNPVDWWDPHWIADRVERKLKDAPATTVPVPTVR
jgi:murein DD-endopeptidase MepM/ murein hydrolase activator NlpD